MINVIQSFVAVGINVLSKGIESGAHSETSRFMRHVSCDAEGVTQNILRALNRITGKIDRAAGDVLIQKDWLQAAKGLVTNTTHEHQVYDSFIDDSVQYILEYMASCEVYRERSMLAFGKLVPVGIVVFRPRLSTNGDGLQSYPLERMTPPIAVATVKVYHAEDKTRIVIDMYKRRGTPAVHTSFATTDLPNKAYSLMKMSIMPSRHYFTVSINRTCHDISTPTRQQVEFCEWAMEKVLNNEAMGIRRGTVAYIHSEPGCGKSTVVTLLTRMLNKRSKLPWFYSDLYIPQLIGGDIVTFFTSYVEETLLQDRQLVIEIPEADLLLLAQTKSSWNMFMDNVHNFNVVVILTSNTCMRSIKRQCLTLDGDCSRVRAGRIDRTFHFVDQVVEADDDFVMA
jgi:hypothetical protein